MKTGKVRVRFAPSPTGPLHMGGVRTALFNYLFAKKHDGEFILRIEDTDQTRYVPGAEDYIIESLKWCGIKIDEGVEQGGPYGPYRQSDRKTLYKEFSDKLVNSGNAYYAFDTADELEAMRERLKTEKNDIQQYNELTRGRMRNSLTLSKEEVDELLNSGVKHVVRFKMPKNKKVIVNDIIRGEVIVHTDQLDDKVLFKSDGMPTYHLANIVDDHLMKISHVIRGEEWLPSLPLHYMLYDALGWKDTIPEFAHLPLLLKPSGKGKLSKRDGDKLGFPVFPLEWKTDKGDIYPGYRENGYFPDAFVNIIALLGWNPGTEQELFDIKELSRSFDMEKVGKSGSRFDPEKAKWFNHKYLQKKSNSNLTVLFHKELEKKGIKSNDDFVAKIISLVKERVSFVSELWNESFFFFEAPKQYDAKFVKKQWKENTPKILSDIKKQFEELENFDLVNIERVIKNYLEENELGMGKVMNPMRLILVGAGKGPGVFEIIEILGRQETIKRIDAGIENIKK
ncbi:MAG: glutamate--tRNA ligase [Patescibacteria group bacterium]|jgi:glutamyl-tRNA synthetase|nr:glutamate--tRNA ligase [Patescibacteria group bacterium]